MCLGKSQALQATFLLGKQTGNHWGIFTHLRSLHISKLSETRWLYRRVVTLRSLGRVLNPCSAQHWSLIFIWHLLIDWQRPESYTYFPVRCNLRENNGVPASLFYSQRPEHRGCSKTAYRICIRINLVRRSKLVWYSHQS